MAKKVTGSAARTQIKPPSYSEGLKKNKTSRPASRKVLGIDRMSTSQQPFTKLNYLLMGGCCVLIIVGFLLMLGGGSSVEDGFNPDIFSTRRIVVGPAIAFLGFLLLAFAILVDPKKKLKKDRDNTLDNENNTADNGMD